MCGRYSFAPKPKQIDAQMRDIQRPLELKISFNIAPTHKAYVIANDQPALLQPMIWGLVPHWSADGASSGKLINARGEGIEERPSFSEPVRTKRCLVPADSFYEWRTGPGKTKMPYRIMLKSDDLMFMAGIWDEWRKGDEVKRSFSIITTAPNREVSALHNRMPVMFTCHDDQRKWLSDLPLDAALDMLHPPADGILSMYRVSEKMNAPGYDEPDLHETVREQPTLFS